MTMQMQVKHRQVVEVPQDHQGSHVQYPQRLVLLAMLAVAGLVVLLASAWLLPLVSEYELIGDNISEMVLGDFGWVQTAAFVIAGIGILALAYAIWALTERAWRAVVGSLLIAVYGVGALVVAIFPTEQIDRASEVWSQGTAGTIHVVVATVSFFCAIVAMFLLTWEFLREARWRPHTSWWMMLFPSAALPLFFAQGEGPRVGLMQRALVTVISAWLILVALRARSIAASGEEGTSR
jgi:hypothetical protein